MDEVLQQPHHHHHQEDKNEDGSANNEVNIHQDLSSLHGGDNEGNINHDPAVVHGGDNELNVNQDLAAVHGGDNEGNINHDPDAVLGGDIEVNINHDPAAVHGGDNEVNVNQDPTVVLGADNEVNINQDPAAVHGGDNEVNINQNLADVLGGLGNVINPEIIQASYLQLVREYLRVLLGNPPHHQDNAADNNYELLVAIRRFLDVNNIYAPNAPDREITVEMHRLNNQLVTAVIGPLGVLNINLEDHRRAYPPSRKEDPEVLNLEESSILVVNRAARVWIVKKLSNSDVRQKAAKVVLPLVFVRDQIIPILLNDDDSLEDGIQVDVYNDQLQRFQMVFKTVRNIKYYVLQMGWRPFVDANGYLTANTNVKISAFRHFTCGKLCFSVVPA